VFLHICCGEKQKASMQKGVFFMGRPAARSGKEKIRLMIASTLGETGERIFGEKLASVFVCSGLERCVVRIA
jgi:hypothetical protein